MKTVLVTGGSRGIGRAVARRFAERGFCVGICYEKNREAAEEIFLELNKITQVHLFQADFSQSQNVVSLANTVQEEMGSIDVLVNNAGVSSYGLFQDTTEEEFERVFSVNFKSMFFLTKALIPSMIQNQKGVIVNVSSIWGQTGGSMEVLYSASKAAVIGFTKALAKEVAPSGIRVNCIAPGVVDTDMMAQFSLSEKEALAESIPTGSFSDPDEIAQLALFLSQDGARNLTGQVIGINGGMYS